MENPDEVVVHTVHTCTECGTSLESVTPENVESRQVGDIPKPVLLFTEHRVESKRCPHCSQLNRAEFPPDVRYPVQYGPHLKALMVYLCIFQLLPYDRVSELFHDLFGRSVSKATLVKAVSECSQNLTEVEERIRELLSGARVLHVDETGMRVVGIRQWLHVASTDLLTLYAHHRKRGSTAMDAMNILPRFKGVMVHDFWSPYFRRIAINSRLPPAPAHLFSPVSRILLEPLHLEVSFRFFRELPLGRLCFEGENLPEVEIHAGEDIFDMHSGHRRNHEMTCMEHPFHHGERPFHQRACSADGPVSPVLLDRKGMIAGRPVHGLVHGCLRFHPEVALVAIDRLAFPGEIDPAVVERRGGGLDPADQLTVLVEQDVEFVPEPGLRALPGPGTVAASPRPCLVTPGSVGRGVTRISGDERSVLHDTAFDGESLYLELPLELIPDHRIFPGLRQAFPEQPDRRPIRNGLWVSQEVAKRDPVGRLPFQFRIRQTIPLLEHQQADHENDVTVRTTASTLGVGVQVGKEWTEGIPVDQTADLTQPITQGGKGGIFVPNCEIGKRAHEKNVDPGL